MAASERRSRMSLALFVIAASVVVQAARGQGPSSPWNAPGYCRSHAQAIAGQPRGELWVPSSVPQWQHPVPALPPPRSVPVRPADPWPAQPSGDSCFRYERLPPVVPTMDPARKRIAVPSSYPVPGPTTRACCPWEVPSCPDVPYCANSDACLQHRLPPQKLCDSGYQLGGVHSFISVFEAAAARGIENAAIRAFNSTSVCPTCRSQPPPPDPCVQPTTAAPGATTRDENSPDRRPGVDPRQLSQLQIRRDLVTGEMTMIDQSGHRVQVDPSSIPPQGIWWSTTNRRLETAGPRGNPVAFGDPRAAGFRFQNLVEGFKIELEEATRRVIMTHKQSGRSFTFDPRP